MTGERTETQRQETATIERVACDVHGCHRSAVEVLTFRDQLGHVHVCGPCGAVDREYCDVATSSSLPCSLPHGDGSTWVDKPRELR